MAHDRYQDAVLVTGLPVGIRKRPVLEAKMSAACLLIRSHETTGRRSDEARFRLGRHQRGVADPAQHAHSPTQLRTLVTLRHATASLLKDLGAPARDTQIILGHATSRLPPRSTPTSTKQPAARP